MERKIEWTSGLFDEIDLVYEKAEGNERIASALSELEDQALREAERNCGLFIKAGKPVTPAQFRAMPWLEKEMMLYSLGNGGLNAFHPSLEEPIITVTLSCHIQKVLGCTMFSILNRLEKLDGAYNEALFPKATLELQIPLGGKKGFVKYEMLLMQLYPWLGICETSTNEMAVMPE